MANRAISSELWAKVYSEVHGGTRLDITEGEVTGGHTAVSVEQSPDFVVVFWEFFSIWDTGIIFHIVVEDVDGFFLEQFSDFLVVVHHFSQVTTSC